MEPSDQPSRLSHFLSEMRRRHVVRFALGYAAAAFVVLQLAEIVFPAFGISDGGLRVLVVLTALGFLPALVLAWVYDLTTEGITRTEEGAHTAPPSRLALAALLGVTVLITGGLALYLADQGVLSPTEGAGVDAPAGVRAAAYDPDEPIRSLAVLPLDDFSPSGDQAYFTSGMHEELIAKLSVLEGVRVVSRTTVMQYADSGTRPSSPQIGRDLGVDVLVEGSVSRSDERVRVTLQIIHAPSDSHIETLQWDRENVEDVLAFQTEIAHAVVHEIGGEHEEASFEDVRVAGIEPQAQEAYLRARHEYDRGTLDGYRMALEYFQQALDEDPDFAAAKAGAAGARFLLGLEAPEPAGEELRQARADAMAALDMDSSSVEAKEVLAYIERGIPEVSGTLMVPDAPLPGSGAHVIPMPGTFDSVRIDIAGYDTTWVAAVTGLGERIEERVRRLELRSFEAEGRARAVEARQLMSRGRYAEGARLLEEAVTEDPGNGPAWDMLARARASSGDPDGAVDAVSQWQASGASGAPDEASAAGLRDAVRAEGVDGYWSWELERLSRSSVAGEVAPRAELATAHAALGQRDEALRYLSEALAQGELGVLAIHSDPVWDDLRSDPRFQQLARQVRTLRFAPIARPPGRPGGPGR